MLDATEVLLADCDCESSCYQCLRHYGNNFDHASLDRRLALALLRYLKNGQMPELEPGERQGVLTSLVELVRLKELHATQDASRNGVTVPLVITRDDGSEVWVDVHHPLVDAHTAPSHVREAAETDFVEFCSLDAFTLRHDLPSAYDTLQV